MGKWLERNVVLVFFGGLLTFGACLMFPSISKNAVDTFKLVKEFYYYFICGGIILAGSVFVYFATRAIDDARPRRQVGSVSIREEYGVPDPPMLRDGTAGALKIVYMDENGCYVSPHTNERWNGDHMVSNGKKGVCAINPRHPNHEEMLESYAQSVIDKGYTPIQIALSMQGKIDLLENGEIIADEADIISSCEYYE